MFSKVTDFHRAFGALVAETSALPDRDTRSLRQRIFTEEWVEFLTAEEADDLVEVADALGDMQYIITGTCVSYGLVPARRFFLDRPPPPAAFPHLLFRSSAVATLEAAVDAYQAAEASNRLEPIRTALYALLENLSDVAFLYGIPFEAVCHEIHASNMSKLGADGKPIHRADGKILKGPGYFRPRLAALLFPADV